MTAFQFRVANARQNQLIDVQARIILSRFVDAGNGRKRQYYALPLERPSVAFFPLSWTVVHPIDPASPLHTWTLSQLAESEAEFLVLLTATDETFSQTVHSRTSYRADAGEILWNARFASMYEPLTAKDDLAIDMRKLNSVIRD
jgi:inward rectifier potassium channel